MALHSLYCADVPLRNCSPPAIRPSSWSRGRFWWIWWPTNADLASHKL